MNLSGCDIGAWAIGFGRWARLLLRYGHKTFNVGSKTLRANALLFCRVLEFSFREAVSAVHFDRCTPALEMPHSSATTPCIPKTDIGEQIVDLSHMNLSIAEFSKVSARKKQAPHRRRHESSGSAQVSKCHEDIHLVTARE